MTSMRAAVAALLVASGAALAGTNLAAQEKSTFADHPLRVIVPFSPGGATDQIARTVSQALGERLGQTVVVENKAGANGNIGALMAARAPADGYTLLVATSSHAVNATLYKKLDYSLTRDFAALSNLASVPLLLVVHPSVAAQSAQELSALARKDDLLNYGSGGTGTAAHLAGAQFATLTGSKITHVPYKGGAQALQDLVGGQVQMMFGNLPEMLPQVKAGRLRPIALTGDTRHPLLPEVPTFAEAGFPQIQAQSWFAMFAPAGVPAPLVEKLSDAIAQSVATPAVQEKLAAIGAQPIGNRHAQFQPFVEAEVQRWGQLVQASGATAD